MTDMEIPQALVEDAVDVFLAARYPDAGIYTANKTRPNSPAVGMRAALEFALPHLLTEVKSDCRCAHPDDAGCPIHGDGARIFTAAEVREAAKVANALGLALGRKQALVDAEAAILAFDYDMLAAVGLVADVRTVHTALAKIVRDMASQPQEAASNGLTASSRHPGTPEDTKPPQEGANPTVDLVGALRKAVDAARGRRLAEQARIHDRDEAAPDLPEESDQ